MRQQWKTYTTLSFSILKQSVWDRLQPRLTNAKHSSLEFPTRKQSKETLGIARIPSIHLNALMGRRIPASDNNQNLLLIHPLLYFSFLAATLAASIVIITALCGVRSRKKDSSPPPSDHLHTTSDLDAELPQTNDEVENQNDDLHLPPAMQHSRESRSTRNMKKASSERRLSFSLSLKKVPRSLSVAKHSDPKEDGRKKEKLKAEESVWMKTIILGDKCVPDEEESAVIYEGKGKKISAYHPRNNSTLSISKQMSSIDQDIHPDPNIQKQQTDQNDM